MFQDLINNPCLICALVAWFISGFLKLPIYYLQKKKWNWGLWLDTGHMPSTHSALMAAVTLAIGLFIGFGTPLFALAFVFSMIVYYDAAGVRRQAGKHAQRINLMINEIFRGQPVTEDMLKEVLGHTPKEVIGGIVTGSVITLIIWLLW